jgi:competence protein CoiA
MQWIALKDERPVFANEADKHARYHCPECGAHVKVRSGPHRQPHYYHLRAAKRCRQHQKSEEHLGLQFHLTMQFLPGAVRMERPFPEVGRIADVAWEKERVVFEVQCSPISLTEVQERTRDYRSQGWHLIWILSDKRFNRRKLTTAEYYLRQQTCYFASWNKQRPVLYDQWDIVADFQRVYKGPSIPVQPSRIARLPCPIPQHLPRWAQERLTQWPLHLKGDMLTRLLEQPSVLQSLLEREARLTQRTQPLRLPLLALLKQGYHQLLHKLLHSLSAK